MNGDYLKARELLEKFKNGECTPDELNSLHQWYIRLKPRDLPGDIEMAADLVHMQSRLANISKNRTIRIFKNVWFSRVAIFLVLVSLGIGLCKVFRTSSKDRYLESAIHILPGTNQAKLFIEGAEYALDSADNGIRMVQGSILNEDGEIVKNLSGDHIILIQTPRGGQFRASLPDGSQVWLNAESTIKYPSRFNEENRTVEVTGEVYIDVTPDANKPFIVKAHHQIIKVLGTSFNLNAYADDGKIFTTLVEGSLKVSHVLTGRSLIINPGEQSEISKSGDFILKTVETENYSSWIDGVYIINNQSLEAFGNQIERWYNVDVNMGNHKDKTLSAIIRRDVTLKEVLKAIELKTDLQFKIEERRVSVIN